MSVNATRSEGGGSESGPAGVAAAAKQVPDSLPTAVVDGPVVAAVVDGVDSGAASSSLQAAIATNATATIATVGTAAQRRVTVKRPITAGARRRARSRRTSRHGPARR
jgi:hypothetical protein